MKAIKLLTIYRWIAFASIILYATRVFGVPWLTHKIYIKQHGSLQGSPLQCYPIPPFFAEVMIFSIMILAFILIRYLERQFSMKSTTDKADYTMIAVVTILIILPFAYFDFLLLQLVSGTITDYFSAEPLYAKLRTPRIDRIPKTILRIPV